MFIDLKEKGGGGEKERERERERERWEKHWLVASHTHPNQGSTLSIGMCPDQGLNLQPFGVQDDTPTNWAIWPRREPIFITTNPKSSKNPGLFLSSIYRNL